MPKQGIARLAVSVALLLFVITTVLVLSDHKAVELAFSELVLSSLVVTVILLFGGVVLSSLRLKLITADLGYPLSFRDAAMTLSVGQLAGSVFFQFAGQLVGRGAVMSRRGIPPAATVVISGYERVVALSVSLLLAGGGALYLFGTLSIHLDTGGLPLVKLVFGLAAATAAGALLAWGRTVLEVVRNATPELLLRLLRSFAISLAIQVTTLAAYIALGRALAPHIGLASFAAAACIVMLAASLPISFGGWGLRELSAVVALQAIGLSSASALLIALLIGFLSLAVIAGTALFVMLGWNAVESPQAAIPATPVPDYTAALDWSLPLVAATAVFFQIYLPTASGLLSVNLADPVAMLAAVLFLFRYAGRNRPDWRIPQTEVFFAAASAVILFALLRGWASFGWTDWAFANKAFGWIVLVCYAATGALIVRRAPHAGFELLLKTFVAAGVAVAVIETGFATLRLIGVPGAHEFVGLQVSGFSQNPNAFAFVLLLVFAAATVLQARPAVRHGLMVAALLGVWFTGSRAGLIAAPFVLAVALYVGAGRRTVLTAAASTAAIIAGIALLSMLARVLGLGGSGTSIFIVLGRDEAASTAQHLQTIEQGLAMFLQHPVFGGGLGAYMHDQIRSTGGPLVIHSTSVWLLAETGIIGFAVFLAAAGRLLALALRERADASAKLLFMMLCLLAVMSLVHELMYQRAFWLLLGAVLAMPAVWPGRRSTTQASG